MNRTDEYLSIGEVVQATGLAHSALRYYEEIGLLEPPRRVSGQRRYDRGVLIQLRLVETAKQAGFTLGEIETLLHGFSEDTPPGDRWRSMALAKLPEIEAMITRAQAMKALLEEGLDCDCLSLEACDLILRENAGSSR